MKSLTSKYEVSSAVSEVACYSPSNNIDGGMCVQAQIEFTLLRSFVGLESATKIGLQALFDYSQSQDRVI